MSQAETTGTRLLTDSIRLEDGTIADRTSLTIATTLNCSGGGTVAVTGSATVTGTTPLVIGENFTSVYTACKATGSDGVVYQLDSSGLTYTMNGTFTATSGSLTMVMAGNMTVAGGSVNLTGALTLTLNLTLTFSGTTAAATGTYSGTEFGNSVSGNF